MSEFQPPAPRSTKALLWLGVPLAALTVQLFAYAPELPDQVASHFDAAGTPDGWMSKNAFLGLMAGLGYGLGMMFVLLAWGTPKLPVSLVNLPNKDYWLAPERRAESYAAMARNLVGHGVLTLGLIVWLFHETYRVNTTVDADAALRFWWPLGLFLGGTAYLLIALFRRFRKPPPEATPV